MKYTLFIFITLFLAVQLHTQNIIVDENKMWSNMQEHCLPEVTTYTTFYNRFEGDTIIDGKSYKMVMIAEDEDYSEWFFFGSFIREENGRVYYREYLGEEGLIYDWNLELGDTVTIDNPLAPGGLLLTLEEIDSIETNDGYRERWKLVKDTLSLPEYWIEGIGSQSGVVNSGTTVFGGLCGGYTLLCASEYDYTVYQNPEYETCYYMLLDDGDEIRAENDLNFDVLISKSQRKMEIRFENDQEKMLMVTNLNGITVSKTQSRDETISIDLNAYPKGVYIVTLIQDRNMLSKKVMVF